MPTSIDFESVTAGFSSSYSEAGFTLSSALADVYPSQDEPFWSGRSFSNVTDGGYLLNNYSSDTVIVRHDDGKAFGAASIDVDGFSWAGSARSGTSEVTFTFVGVREIDGQAFEWAAPATDLVDGFQTLALPAEFAAGLIELRWTVSGGTGWGAFDNLELQLNRAPTADAVAGAAVAGVTLEGAFDGQDADGQALTYEVVGDQPAGVYLDGSAFYVVSDPNAASPQVVTFDYRAFDGSEYSAAATVSVTVGPAPAGPDLVGGDGADVLEGTAGGEHILGLAGDDQLSGAGGADEIEGGAGLDMAWGGDGHDRLSGGDDADALSGEGGDDTLAGDAGDDSLDGGDGGDLILGGADDDVLTGGAGDDTLLGGAGHDQFVFDQAFGLDVVGDFQPGHWTAAEELGGVWVAGDTLRISPATFGSFSEFMAHATQVGDDVVVATDDGLSGITLAGVSLGALNLEDVLFA